jgi:hypothetical protein
MSTPIRRGIRARIAEMFELVSKDTKMCNVCRIIMISSVVLDAVGLVSRHG